MHNTRENLRGKKGHLFENHHFPYPAGLPIVPPACLAQKKGPSSPLAIPYRPPVHVLHGKIMIEVKKGHQKLGIVAVVT